MLLVIWLSFTLTGMDRFVWSSISAPAGPELHLAVASLGQFTTAFYVGYAVSCSVGGVLSDMFGGRTVLTWSLLPLGHVRHQVYRGIGTCLLGVRTPRLRGMGNVRWTPRPSSSSILR